MRTNDKFDGKTQEELKDYIRGHENILIKRSLGNIQTVFRNVLAVDMNCHPKLLFIYNQFLRLKEIIEQHIYRKEQFLFPFIKQLTEECYIDLISSRKVVESFLSVFKAENDKVAALLQTISEASDNYNAAATAPAALKKMFRELDEFSGMVYKLIEKENRLFSVIQESGEDEQLNRENKRA